MDRRDENFRAVKKLIWQLRVDSRGGDAKLLGLLADLANQEIVRAEIDRRLRVLVEAGLQNQKANQSLSLTCVQFDDDIAAASMVIVPLLEDSELRRTKGPLVVGSIKGAV